MSQKIVLPRLDNDRTLHEIHSVDTGLRPVNITGDVIALSDDFSKMAIYNWKTDECAYLDDIDDPQYGHCLQVIFIPPTILVVRARSITLYDSAFTHIATHSVNGASATPTSVLIQRQSLGIRAKLTPALLPLLFSSNPRLENILSMWSSSMHRCHLGKRGTAVWILPQDCAMTSHWEEHDVCETFIAAVFPGPLNPIAEVRVHEVCMNGLDNWTAFDYDEDLGRIAFGSGFEKITIV